MGGDDLLALILGAAAIALVVSWPVLPGLRRLSAFKPWPPFRAWAAQPHPDAAVTVRAGRRLDLTPTGADAAHATVVVRTAWRNQDSRDVQPSLRISRPLTPVVYVDGRPAAWGWGTIALTLAPGQHLIAVASSHSRCYRTVVADRGARIDLDYASIIGDTAHRYRLAEAEVRDLTAFTLRRSGPGAYTLVMVVGITMVAAITGAAIVFPPAASAFIGNAVWGAIALGLGIGIAAIALSLARQVRARRTTIAPAPYGHEAPAVRVLDADMPQRMAPAPGWAGLGLHLQFAIAQYRPEALASLAGGGRLGLFQRWRAVRIGEPEAPACRPWVPAPLVLLDGQEIPASWTRMWMQIAPGDHEVIVRVGAPSSQVDGWTRLDFDTVEIRRAFTATAGATLDMAFAADITAIPAPDRPRLDEYRIHLR